MTNEAQISSGTTAAQRIAETLTTVFVDAGMSGNKAKPALMAKQGSRTTYMLSLPIGELFEFAVLRDEKNQSEVTNRPIDDNWIKSIERGLRRKLSRGSDSSKYVIFPFTGNIPENTVKFHPLNNNPGLADIGILVAPRSTKVEIADGQHRLRALRNLVREFPWLGDEAVDLFLIEESDILQQRTDFADAAKVLPINVGLQAWFDSGVALNRATHRLVQHSKNVTDEAIEKFKVTVSGRRNPKIWTYNSLRGYVGSSLVRGTPQKTEELSESFEDAISRLGWDAESPEMDTYIDEIAAYLDMALECSTGTLLKDARKDPDVDWNKIRERSWLLKPAGLGTFGLFIHDLRETAKQESPGQERSWVEEKVVEVFKLDWSCDSPVFKGTLVKGGRTQGSSTALSHAAVVLEAKLGVLQRVPRRTAESLLDLYKKGELELSREESESIRMAKRES